jgi:large subunit ribosomal protein L2
MGYRKLSTSSAGARHATIPDFAEITKGKPEKSLLIKLKYHAGHNSQGRITCWHKGDRHARQYRMIDFKRAKLDLVGTVVAIEYDPNRNCRIALVQYSNGDKGYILAAKDLEVGAKITSFSGVGEPNVGNAMELRHIPQGLNVHNVELQPGKGGQMARSAGSGVQLVAKDGGYATLRLPSGEMRRVMLTCRATVGQVGNVEHQNVTIGKAGRNRWLGKRPGVRGSAMNPVDHPHGGGEGKSKGGRHPVTPWGVPTLGKRTRSKNKTSDKLIVRGRRRGKDKR